MKITYYYVLILVFFNISCKKTYIDKRYYYETGEVKERYVYEEKDTSNYNVYFFYKNGQLEGILPIRNSMRHGKSVFFHDNGRLANVSSYFKDKGHGITVVFSEKGILTKKYLYLYGKQIIFIRKINLENQKYYKYEAYEVDKKEVAHKIGELFYNNMDQIVPDSSSYYIITVADTIRNNTALDVTINVYEKDCTDCGIEVLYFDLDSLNYNSINEKNITHEFTSNSLQVKHKIYKYMIGDNLLIGLINVIDYNKRDTIKQYILFEDFFVTPDARSLSK